MYKRIFSFLLVLLVICSCFLPSMIVPARAVALVDDAALAVSLLFAGWSGVTFGRSDHAVQAMQKFLTDCADAAQDVAYLVANYVKDGVLQLVAAEKARYASIIAAMKMMFTSSAGEDGTLSGTLGIGSINKPYDFSSDKVTSKTVFRFNPFLDFQIIAADGVTLTCKPLTKVNGPYVYYWLDVYNGSEKIGSSAEKFYKKGIVPSGIDFFKYALGILYDGKLSTWDLTRAPFSIALGTAYTINAIKDNITYLQDAAVDGTSALDQLETLPEPDPDAGDDDETPMVPIPLGPEIGTIQTGQGVDANGNPLIDADGNPLVDADGNPLTQTKPALNPSEMIDALIEAIKNAQSQPKPDPDPDNPGEDTDDERTKRHDADWKNVFPFCVPFDLIEFLGVLAADPVAPSFDWRFYAPNVVDYTLHVDLSDFDSVAQICRRLELLAFCVGLILITRNIIRG